MLLLGERKPDQKSELKPLTQGWVSLYFAERAREFLEDFPGVTRLTSALK